MLDPIVTFFTGCFSDRSRHWPGDCWILLWPFMWAVANWYVRRGWIIKGPIGSASLLGLIALYAYFIWQTQVWTNFDPDYVNATILPSANDASQPVAPDRRIVLQQGAAAGQAATAKAMRAPAALRRSSTSPPI